MLFAVLALVAGTAAGWFAHKRLSLHYKARWLALVKVLEAKQLESSDLDTPLSAAPATGPPAYLPGKWTLHEVRASDKVIYQAVRRGFDPVALGTTANYKVFTALYRRDRENAAAAVEDMNAGG